MKVFVDECVNKLLMAHLIGHTVVHITDTSLRGTQNGELLQMISSDYEVFLTIDRNIPFQQNLRRFSLAFIIIHAQSNKLADLLPLVPDVLNLLNKLDCDGFQPGDLHEIFPT